MENSAEIFEPTGSTTKEVHQRKLQPSMEASLGLLLTWLLISSNFKLLSCFLDLCE